MSKAAYIYLLQDGEDKNTTIYKIGKTVQTGDDTRVLRRLQAYTKDTVVFNTFCVSVEKVDVIEETIKKVFVDKYALARGKEWFDGNIHEMKKDIDKIIDDADTLCVKKVESTHICKYCSTSFSTKSNLETHITHSKKCSPHEKSSFDCTHCNKPFTSNRRRLEHTEKCHLVNNKQKLVETMYKKLLEEKDKQIAALTEQIKHLHEKLSNK